MTVVSEYWIDPKSATSRYRSVIQRLFDSTGTLIGDRDVTIKYKYNEKDYPAGGLQASRMYYPASTDEEVEDGNFAIEEGRLEVDGFVKVNLCKAKKFLDYKGPWPP